MTLNDEVARPRLSGRSVVEITLAAVGIVTTAWAGLLLWLAAWALGLA